MKVMLFGLNGRGGPLHYCSSLSSGLANHGVQAHVLLPSYSNTKFIDKKVKLLRIKAPPNAFLTILESLQFWKHRKIIRQIRKCKPDLINILDIHPWYYWYLNKLKDIPLIVTINDPELHSGEAGWLMTKILKFLTKNYLDRAKHIIVLGKKQVEVLHRMGYKKKDIFASRIGHYGFFKPNKPIEMPHGKTVLFFGRVKFYKGIDILLKAFVQVQQKHPDARVLIVGEGDMAPYQKLIKKLKNVEVVNTYVPDRDVWKYYNQSSFVVMPYRDATQTGIIQIAYAFKRPVIATSVGSLPELIDDAKTGYLIQPKKTKILAEKIIDLLDDPEKTLRFGEAAFNKMNIDLNWTTISKEVKDYYERVITWEQKQKN